MDYMSGANQGNSHLAKLVFSNGCARVTVCGQRRNYMKSSVYEGSCCSITVVEFPAAASY